MLSPTSENEKLRTSVKLAYGTGHVLNDMCAALVFTYLLLYLTRVIGFSNSLVGLLFIIVQISDGIFTVFIGYFQDRGEGWWLCQRYNKRKAWHLIGTIVCIIFFPLIFMPCIGCDNAPPEKQFVYYCFFVTLANCGWGCAQISHLALIPELTSCQMEQTSLSSYRYTAKIISNVIVYFTMWLFLGSLSSKDDEPIGPDSANVFRNVCFISVGFGGCMSVVFHFAVRSSSCPVELKEYQSKDSTTACAKQAEILDKSQISQSCISDVLTLKDGGSTPQSPIITDDSSPTTFVTMTNSQSTLDKSPLKHEPMKVSDWLRKPQFWKVCVIYVCAKLFVNISQAYLPLYLEVTLELKSTSVATMPLVIFLSGLFTSPFMETFTRMKGRKGVTVITSLVGLGGSTWVYFGGYANSEYKTWGIYFAVTLFGASGSALLISSIAAIADLIGDNAECSSSVFGLALVTEKVVTAAAFGCIQNLVPDGHEEIRDYYRNILVFVCGAAAILPTPVLFFGGVEYRFCLTAPYQLFKILTRQNLKILLMPTTVPPLDECGSKI